MTIKQFIFLCLIISAMFTAIIVFFADSKDANIYRGESRDVENARALLERNGFNVASPNQDIEKATELLESKGYVVSKN